MLKVKNIQILSIIGAVVLFGAGCVGSSTIGKNTIETPSGKKINVEVARTLKEQSIGLSGKENVGDGMVFCFDKSKQKEFWMLGMMVPIDMIWINDGVVIGVADNVPLKEMGDITRRKSVRSIDAVLEVGAGMAEKLQIKEGSRLPDVKEICG